MTAIEIRARDYLPDCDLPLWRAVELAAWRYACLHHVPLRAVEPMRNHSGNNLGLCYQDEGRISIVVRKKLDSGLWRSAEKGMDILDTLAHELAHLLDKSTEGHSRRWRLEFSEIREAMIEDGLHHELDGLRK